MRCWGGLLTREAATDPAWVLRAWSSAHVDATTRPRHLRAVLRRYQLQGSSFTNLRPAVRRSGAYLTELLAVTSSASSSSYLRLAVSAAWVGGR